MFLFNAQDASGGKVPMKPGDCNDCQDTIKTPPKTLLTRLVPGHKLYQMLQNVPNAKQTLTNTNNCLQKMLLTRLAPSR